MPFIALGKQKNIKNQVSESRGCAEQRLLGFFRESGLPASIGSEFSNEEQIFHVRQKFARDLRESLEQLGIAPHRDLRY